MSKPTIKEMQKFWDDNHCDGCAKEEQKCPIHECELIPGDNKFYCQTCENQMKELLAIGKDLVAVCEQLNTEEGQECRGCGEFIPDGEEYVVKAHTHHQEYVNTYCKTCFEGNPEEGQECRGCGEFIPDGEEYVLPEHADAYCKTCFEGNRCDECGKEPCKCD